MKASVFGLILSLAACYHGFNTVGGAAGVGESATKSVVLGCVTILISDYFLTSVML
ncbi:MAG: ABC transporter permease [Deltaproteobacteria bacterium]